MSLQGMKVVIVGAGVVGLHSANLMASRGASVIVLERESGVGGVWRVFANESSRVQVPEPSYRLINGKKMEADFAIKGDVIAELENATQILKQQGGQVRFGCNVVSVEDGGPENVLVRYSELEGRPVVELKTDHVIFCTGGLQKPRKIELPQENRFKGNIVYGCGGEPDAVEMKGKSVLVMGMGAFAVENARECMFRGAKKVTILARNRNMILPKLISYTSVAEEQDVLPMREINRQRRGKKRGSTKGPEKDTASKAEDMLVTLVTLPFEMCNAEESMPTELLEMKRTRKLKAMQNRESLGTIQTASDAFFIGHACGKLRSVKGSVAEVLPDGVITTDGETIDADVIIKNFGFEDPDGWIPNVCGIDEVHSPMIISKRIWLFKCERAKPTPEMFGSGDVGSILNLPAAATVFAEMFTEMFDHYSNHEDELNDLLEPGKLPTPKLGSETYLHMCKGFWTMMQHNPDVAARVNNARRQLGRNTKERYDMGEFIKQNRKWWKECCQRITGDEDSVPYIWDPLAGVLESIQGRKEEEAAPVSNSGFEQPTARL